MAKTLKVSVVVPVYNPGPYIEDCVASLMRQSLPDDEYEAIFVDDGSTDETPARLDALAAEHPHLHVIHQENSGWSGKPRNVGIAAARGEYVFFVDNDDWIGDEALERMYAFAKENDSDIVIGKMAGKGRGVPRELFRRTYPRATLANAPLIDSLTPHKMFRKAFLDDHQLRFPEGRRRLEDHVFVTAAFFAAGTISVLSDYVCYYHVRREDASNAGFQRLEPKGYFANLTEALDIVEKNTDPGPLRDRLYRRWFRVEMIERLRGRRLLQVPAEDQRALFEEIRRISGERFGPGVAEGLPPSQRIVAALIHADRLDDLVRLAEWETSIVNHAELDDLGWYEGALQLALTCELRAGRAPVGYLHADGQDVLVPPLADDAAGALPDADRDATARLNQSRIDVLLRSRETAAEYFLPVTFASSRRALGDGDGDGDGDGESFRFLLHGEARLDPTTAGGGVPLERGIWDVVARITSCGWTKDARLGSVRSVRASRHCVPAVLGDPAVAVTPYWTDKGNLSVDVGEKTSRLRQELLFPTAPSLATAGNDLVLTLPLCAVTAAEVAGAVRLAHEDSGAKVDAAAVLAPAVDAGVGRSDLSARLSRSDLGVGRWSVQVRLVTPEHGGFTPLPVSVTVPSGPGVPVVEALDRSTTREARTDDGPEERTEGFRSELSAWLRTGRRLARRAGGRLTRQVRRSRG